MEGSRRGMSTFRDYTRRQMNLSLGLISPSGDLTSSELQFRLQIMETDCI